MGEKTEISHVLDLWFFCWDSGEILLIQEFNVIL